MDNAIATSVDLWKEIEQVAQFEHKAYDYALLEQIRSNLHFLPKANMKKYLKQHNTSCEELLGAVLDALLPFSQMLKDLLKMFEDARAQQTAHNLKIKFDFSKYNSYYEINLDQFKQQFRSSEKIWQCIDCLIPLKPWDLVYGVRKTGLDATMVKLDPPEDVQLWQQEYRRKRENNTWPEWLPEQPKTGDSLWDEQIAIIWEAIEMSMAKYRQEWTPDWHSRKQTDHCFWQAETDYWIGCLVETIGVQVMEFHRLPEEVKRANAAQYAQCYKKAVQECGLTKVSVVTKKETIIEILNLPFWRKRYELYSAWVATQIVDTLYDKDIAYNVQDNTLSFSFGGSKIATCNAFEPPLDIWTEVRTPYATPKGGNRKCHIQPDYTLVVADAGDASAKDIHKSLAVIECKQYKRHNRRNFLYAVDDYARGRPNAEVLLVNYGRITKPLIDEVEPDIRQRVGFYEQVYPGTEGTRDVRERLRKCVEKYYNHNQIVRMDGVCDTPCSIILKWNSSPKDLDLHLYVNEKSGTSAEISYRNRGRMDQWPYAILNHDDRQGNGEENIQISRWTDAVYEVLVSNYSGEISVTDCITVEIWISGKRRMLATRTDPIEKGAFWHVFHIENNHIELENEVLATGV